jgi:hypothetical protein
VSDLLSQEDGRRRIEHEDNLIHYRISWSIGSQAFLLTAFVLLTNDRNNLARTFTEQTGLLVYLITIAGILIGTCTTIGVFAAFSAIRYWRNNVSAVGRKFLTAEAHLVSLGGMAAALPGPVLTSIWVVLLINEWPHLSGLRWPLLITPFFVAIVTLLGWRRYAHTFTEAE